MRRYEPLMRGQLIYLKQLNGSMAGLLNHNRLDPKHPAPEHYSNSFCGIARMAPMDTPPSTR